MKTLPVSKAVLLCLWFIFFCLSFTARTQELPADNQNLFVTALEKKALHELPFKNETLLFFMAYDSSLDINEYSALKNELTEFAVKLESRKSRFKKDMEYAKFVFDKTHDKYLRHYIKYVPFNQVFHSGDYNCLSGTALYAYLFERLGFQVQIFETRYHSFLTITNHSEHEVLIEATDGENGFINGADKVKSRIEEYQLNESKLIPDRNTVPVEHYPKLNPISIKELAGLHYLNLAVVHFNISEYQKSLISLKKAELLYPASKRIKEMVSMALLCSYEPRFSDFYSSDKK